MTTSLRQTLCLALAALASAGASAHGSSIGDIAIGHPYAVPTLAGATTGAAYFSALENKGEKPDRLLRASTPAAARVEIHSMSVDAKGVMRMRELDGIAVAPKQTVTMKPGAGLHLMLVGLKAPLREGESFAMTLQFERAGTTEVRFVVQAPHASEVPMPMHQH